MSYSATTQTRPLGKELTNQNVTRKQKIAIFFSNKPITLKNTLRGEFANILA